jgi:hypothetical protein
MFTDPIFVYLFFKGHTDKSPHVCILYWCVTINGAPKRTCVNIYFFQTFEDHKKNFAADQQMACKWFNIHLNFKSK